MQVIAGGGPDARAHTNMRLIGYAGFGILMSEYTPRQVTCLRLSVETCTVRLFTPRFRLSRSVTPQPPPHKWNGIQCKNGSGKISVLFTDLEFGELPIVFWYPYRTPHSAKSVHSRHKALGEMRRFFSWKFLPHLVCPLIFVKTPPRVLCAGLKMPVMSSKPFWARPQKTLKADQPFGVRYVVVVVEDTFQSDAEVASHCFRVCQQAERHSQSHCCRLRRHRRILVLGCPVSHAFFGRARL